MNAPALVSHEHPCPTRTSLGPQGQATQIGEWRPHRTTIEAPQSELLPSQRLRCFLIPPLLLGALAALALSIRGKSMAPSGPTL